MNRLENTEYNPANDEHPGGVAEGGVLQNPAEYMWGAALPPHSLENIGDKELRIVAVELKD